MTAMTVTPDVTSQSIAIRLKQGERAALDEMFHRWSSTVYTLALRRLGDHHEAEEVTQQTFVSAWKSRESVDINRVSFPAWLIGIAKHRIADRYSANARENRRVEAVAQVTQTTDPAHDDSVLDEVVVQAIMDGLDEPRRTIMRLAFMDDMTHPQVAQATGLALGTVKSHIRRGLQAMRKSLQEVDIHDARR